MLIRGTAAIITGGASGMGLATAQHLNQLGANVTLLDVNPEAINTAIKSCNGLGFACDVSDPNAVAKALHQAEAAHGIARICVNCAGIAPAERIVGREGPMDLAAFENVIRVNLIGSFNVLRLAAAAMYSLEPLGDSGERGVIINTASVAAYEGQIGQAAYSASKGGIVAMTLPAAREFASFGIRVNTIAPGLVETPMLLSMPAEVQASLAASVPFPKRLAKPSEFAALVEHIISNEMINGTVIRLDGAIRLQAK